jgi:hypothetical protein
LRCHLNVTNFTDHRGQFGYPANASAAAQQPAEARTTASGGNPRVSMGRADAPARSIQ